MAIDQNLIPNGRAFGVECAAPGATLRQAGEMFTAKELEQLLKLSVKTIYRYVQCGLIPYVRIQSNVRFPKSQILEWIERQSYKPHPHNVSSARRR